MLIKKCMLPIVLLCVVVIPVNAWWGYRETEEQRQVRIENQKKYEQTLLQQQAVARIKADFRLESSYSALKEVRKALTAFVLVYPAMAHLLNYFDTASNISYYKYIPHSVLGLFVVWATENILRVQVELNQKQQEQLSALTK